MMKNWKRLLFASIALVVLFAMIPGFANLDVAADTTAVAKVGNTEYATIDEAIANWTNGTTLTLLSDVTLSDVIKLSSTEYHILDLGIYTITAASKKDAIQIENNGRSSASYALDIKADATTPGGITATGKAVVRTAGKSGVKDRPIIRFYGGVFNASYIVYHSGSNGTNCPQFQFHGGEFNGTIFTNRALNQFYGGTFNGSLMMSVDSSAYTLVAGGTFKNLSNLYMSALNSDKFTIGSSKGANNGSVCIDENGNYVITTTTPTVAEASVASNYNSNNYFYYSTVNTDGMYYEDVYDALDANETGTVTVFTDELDLTNSSFEGTIVVPEGEEITIVVADGVTPAWTIKSEVENEEPKVTYTDESGNEVVKDENGAFEVVYYAAQIGATKYATLADAFEAAQDGDTIVLLSDITLDEMIVNTKEITLNLNGKTITGTDNTTKNFSLIDNRGTLTITGNGTMTLTATNNSGWSRYSAVIANNPGGKLIVENGTIEHLGGTDMAYGIDNLTNGKGTYAETVINGGTIKSTYRAIRQFLNGVEAQNILTINGGTVVGENKSVWMQDPNKNANTGKLTVSENAVLNGDVYLFVTAGSTEWPVEVSIAASAVNGDVMTANIPASYALTKTNGTYGVKDISAYVAKIGDTYYEKLEDAIKAVPKNTPTTIYLLRDYTIGSVMVGHQYVQNITIDLGGHTLSNNSIVLTAYRNSSILTVQNGTVKGNASTGTLRATYGGKIILGDNLTVAGAGGSAVLIYADNGTVEISAKNGVVFTGGKQDFRKSTNVNNKLSVEASIGRTYFGTLADAIEAAADGDTISLYSDINLTAEDFGAKYDGYNTFYNVSGKSITIDLNGKNITADVSATTIDAFIIGVFCTTNNGHLTITGNGTVEGISGDTQEQAYLVASKGNKDYNYKFYSLIVTYDNDCSITLNGGNYVLDYAGDSLAYTSSNEGIVVNNGTYKLGNLGGIRNGMPWVFNARGQNVRHVLVKGGSFCADIQHQYYPFEVNVPKELALKKGEDGMYTIVDAVAYVTEREWSSAWYTNEVGYATLEEAIAACEGPKTKSKKTSEQEVVVLLKDITLAENTTIVINKTVVIDLNGKTIYGENTRTATHNFLIDVNGGVLTASNGTIAMKHTGTNMGWNGATTVIDVTAGGVLNLNGVTVQNQGGTDMNFAVHMNNWGEVTLNADNCVFDATYCGVRVFNSGYDMNNVKITNSKLTGATRAFWVHNYLGDLDSSKHSDEAIKARLNLDIYGNNNTFEITGTAKAPIRYGFGDTVYFNAEGSQVVDSAEELQDAINNGSGDITLGGDIDLSELGGINIG